MRASNKSKKYYYLFIIAAVFFVLGSAVLFSRVFSYQLSETFHSAELAALPVSAYNFEKGFITPASCGSPHCSKSGCFGGECPPPPPPGGLSLSLGGSVACNSVPLSWTASAGADGYKILRGEPRVDISPFQPYTALNFTDTTVSQNTTYPYQIEAYNGFGTNRSNEIRVTTPFCPPTLSFSGSPTSIFQGQSTTLTWSTAFTTSCTASGAWSGSKPTSGSEVVIPSPPPSVTYTLTCTGPGGSTGPQSVTINITPLALPNWKEIIPR